MNIIPHLVFADDDPKQLELRLKANQELIEPLLNKRNEVFVVHEEGISISESWRFEELRKAVKGRPIGVPFVLRAELKCDAKLIVTNDSRWLFEQLKVLQPFVMVLDKDWGSSVDDELCLELECPPRQLGIGLVKHIANWDLENSPNVVVMKTTLDGRELTSFRRKILRRLPMLNHWACEEMRYNVSSIHPAFHGKAESSEMADWDEMDRVRSAMLGLSESIIYVRSRAWTSDDEVFVAFKSLCNVDFFGALDPEGKRRYLEHLIHRYALSFEGNRDVVSRLLGESVRIGMEEVMPSLSKGTLKASSLVRYGLVHHFEILIFGRSTRQPKGHLVNAKFVGNEWNFQKEISVNQVNGEMSLKLTNVTPGELLKPMRGALSFDRYEKAMLAFLGDLIDGNANDLASYTRAAWKGEPSTLVQFAFESDVFSQIERIGSMELGVPLLEFYLPPRTDRSKFEIKNERLMKRSRKVFSLMDWQRIRNRESFARKRINDSIKLAKGIDKVDIGDVVSALKIDSECVDALRWVALNRDSWGVFAESCRGVESSENLLGKVKESLFALEERIREFVQWFQAIVPSLVAFKSKGESGYTNLEVAHPKNGLNKGAGFDRVLVWLVQQEFYKKSDMSLVDALYGTGSGGGKDYLSADSVREVFGTISCLAELWDSRGWFELFSFVEDNPRQPTMLSVFRVSRPFVKTEERNLDVESEPNESFTDWLRSRGH